MLKQSSWWRIDFILSDDHKTHQLFERNSGNKLHCLSSEVVYAEKNDNEFNRWALLAVICLNHYSDCVFG